MTIRAGFFINEKLGPKQGLTPEGFLLCEEVPLARTGMMLYGPDEVPVTTGPDGIIKIFREPEDVFTPETLASAQGKPVTNDHPEEDVTPESWRELTHGVMLNVRRGVGAMDDLMVGDILVTTPEGIEAVRSGKIEVSLGYEADYEEVGPGVGRQKNLIINHIALVEQGRCGPRCAIRDAKPTQQQGERNMSKRNKLLDAMMRAFKAKDSAEVEQIANEVQDALPEAAEPSDAATHVHVHLSGENDPVGRVLSGDEELGEGGQRAHFTDDDLQAHMDQNAAEHEEMRERIATLEKMVAQLMGHEAAEGEVIDAGDPSILDEEMPEAAMDEVPEELREQAAKAKDASFLRDSYRDTAALAEILVPGVRIPTFDAAAKPGLAFKKLCQFRRNVLDSAYKDANTQPILHELLGGKKLNTKGLTCDAARTLFRAAAAQKRTLNNAAATRDSGFPTTQQRSQQAKAPSLADLNKRNAEFYK